MPHLIIATTGVMTIQIPIVVTAVLDTKAATPTPIPNEPLDFQHRVTGTTTWTDDGNQTTNSSGKASVTLQLNSGTTYDFQAIFNGDTTNGLAASTGQLLSFQVTAATQVTVTAAP